MALAACRIADAAPYELQQRVFARHAILFAHSGKTWMQRWRKSLARDKRWENAAARAKPVVQSYAASMDELASVRNHLAAKRQQLAEKRSTDIEATLHLWAEVSPKNVSGAVRSMVRAYDLLERTANHSAESIWDEDVLTPRASLKIAGAMPVRSMFHAYASADTAAALRAHTIVAAQGGELGRRTAEINDVAIHLDALLRVAPEVFGVESFDWLVRSAMIVELSALLDLTLGPPDGEVKNVKSPLIELIELDRPGNASYELHRVKWGIEQRGWRDIRTLRNWLGAHADVVQPMEELEACLVELDFLGVIRLSEYLLDWLDFLGATTLDLGGLLLVERKLSTRYDDPLARKWLPDALDVPNLAPAFEEVDSPLMMVASSRFGPAMLAGVTSARRPAPRIPISLPTA